MLACAVVAGSASVSVTDVQVARHGAGDARKRAVVFPDAVRDHLSKVHSRKSCLRAPARAGTVVVSTRERYLLLRARRRQVPATTSASAKRAVRLPVSARSPSGMAGLVADAEHQERAAGSAEPYEGRIKATARRAGALSRFSSIASTGPTPGRSAMRCRPGASG